MTISSYPISRMPHALRIEKDNESLERHLLTYEPGEDGYDMCLDSINENTRRLEIRRLMLEADRREQVAGPTAFHEHGLGFVTIVEQITRWVYDSTSIDEPMQEHYLRGPHYDKYLTPTPEFIRWATTQVAA